MERINRSSSSSSLVKQQALLGFPCKKPIPSTCRRAPIKGVSQNNNNSPTSVKALSHTQDAAADFSLPEKYAILAEFFECMDSAIRLLRLRKTISSFRSICPQVESMAHRRFMHSHVAQMKHIIQEALVVEKMTVHDEKTLCIKPDLKITLVYDALQPTDEGRKPNSMFTRKAFRTRLMEFVKSHPQGDDVPEEPLPEPFNRKCHIEPTFSISPLKSNTNVSTSSTHAASDLPLQPSSLFPSSFKRRFSPRTLKANVSATSSNDPTLNPAENPEGSKEFSLSLMNSHISPGLKTHFTSKLSPAENPQDNNNLEKAQGLACTISLNIGSSISNPPSSTAITYADQSQSPCKLAALERVTQEASNLGETPCKMVASHKDSSSKFNRGYISPSTPEIAPDFETLKTESFALSGNRSPPLKSMLKSHRKTPISKKSLSFGNVSTAPDTLSPVSTPRTLSFASPKSRLFGSPELKFRTSNARRAIAFNREMTPVKKEAKSTETCMVSTPLGASFKPFATPKKNDNLMTNSCHTFLSPTKSLRSWKIQNENSMVNTPPLHNPKRRRCTNEAETPQVKATLSCSQACPSSLHSLESCMEPSKPDLYRSNPVLEDVEKGSNANHQSSKDGIYSVSQSDWEILQSLPTHVVQTVHEREIKILEDCRLGVSAAKRRQQMIACLPNLFNMIRDIFRFCKRTVITQQELVHKIISNHMDITDKREVEDQLKILQELVPDWIFRKTASGGDFLYSIKTNIDLQTIQKRLATAL